MLDLETWGQGSNSVIVQLSAVEFDIKSGEIGEIFNMYIDPNSCISNGLKIEPDTILWWLGQSDDARSTLLKSINLAKECENTLLKVLTYFESWIKIRFNRDKMIWGRGPRFDFGILTDAYKALGIEIPWDFRNERCVRTMEWLRPEIKKSVSLVDSVGHGSEGGGLHNGVTDAIYQAKYVSAIYNSLNA